MCKQILFFLLLLFSDVRAHAQAAWLALIFGDKIATETFHISMDAGLHLSTISGLEKQKVAPGVHFGLGTFIKLNDKFTLTPELKTVSGRGARDVREFMFDSASVTVNDPKTNLSLYYIDIPVLLDYKITPRFSIAAGPMASLAIVAKARTRGKLDDGKSITLTESIYPKINTWDFSVPIQLAYAISNKHDGNDLDIKVRYVYGISELFKEETGVSGHNSSLQIFLSFPLTKKVTPAENGSN